VAFEIVVVGASRGGLKALQVLLSAISEEFRLPMIIVQHRGKDSESGLCDFLAKHSRLPLSEPDDKEPILDGHVYLAPNDYHLLIEEKSFALSTDQPVAFARPSIDLLFETAADEYSDRAIGVILTGVKTDGAEGLAKIKLRGGVTVVEDPSQAAFPEMPQAAIKASKVDWILSLQGIAVLLQQLTNATIKEHAS
jgi:two-component system, chemotaxis family, protein-glutamate methylesterase/glutaminase